MVNNLNDLQRLFEKNVKKKDEDFFKKDNLFYNFTEKKDSEVCLVAHADTVSGSQSDVFLERDVYTYRNKNDEILGADDRVGISAVEILEKMVKAPVDVLITNYEETGGDGSYVFVEDYFEKLKDKYKLFIGFDRRGHDHFVDYNNMAPENLSWIKQFIPDQQTGIFSDVFILSEEFKIPAINVATGFYNEHTNKEFLKIDETWSSILTVKNMIEGLSSFPSLRIK